MSALFDVYVLAQAVDGLLRAGLADAPLTPPEYALYSQLDASPGCTPTHLARVLATPITTVSDWVAVLTARGHVVRTDRPEDRRSYGLVLTPSGAASYAQTQRRFQALDRAFVAHLSTAEAALRAVLADATGAAEHTQDELVPGSRRNRGRRQARPVDEAYVEAVLRTVEQIPPGRVMTYGQVAEHVGVAYGGGGPRQVGTVMSRHGASVPWWRVVRASGLLATGNELRAAEHLRAEAAPLRGSGQETRVDLRRAGWVPASTVTRADASAADPRDEEPR